MSADVPDLTADLTAAEAIVMGRAETVVTEWGIRYNSAAVHERFAWFGNDEEAENTARVAAVNYKRMGGILVRRTVTYGPWETVPRDAQEDEEP